MFSIIIRDTVKTLRNSVLLKGNPSVLPNVIAGFDYSTFNTGDFLNDSSDETGTLLTRFVKYLAMENSKFEPLIPTKIRYPDFFPVSDTRLFKQELMKVDPSQIPNLIIFAFTYKSNGDPQKFVQIINEVDKYCEDNLNQMDYDTILRTLYAFMFLLPNKITKTNFFNQSLDRLVNEFDKEFPKEKFVKVCFYLGLGKKNPKSSKLLKKHLQNYLTQYTPELTSTDLSIIGNAAYKSSISIDNKEFLEELTSQLLSLGSVDDDALLVNLLKIIRLNKLKSAELCKKLDALCTKEELRNFQFTGLAHVFAYFAECQWNNKETCSKFILESMSRIRSSPDNIRAKDLSTFLWCCAQLQQGHLLNENDLRLVDHLVQQMINANEYKYFSDQLIDTALSLWMLGHHSRDLIAEVTSLRINPNANRPDRVKLDTRHKVLLSCVAIEKPEWLMRGKKEMFVEELPAPDYLISSRNGLNTAFEKLKAEGVDVKIVSPIEGINVAGILVKFDKDQKGYLEVVEDAQVLKFNKVPSAIVQLKINLLKHLGYNVVMVRAEELKELDSLKMLFTVSEEPQIKQNLSV